MIGNPKWFEIRKYGWGLKPITKQGWIYVIFSVAVIPLIFLLPIEQKYKMLLTGIWLLILLVDSTHIMLGMKKDEREKSNEALVEKNVSWFIIFSLISIIIYQIATGTLYQNITLNLLLVIILLGALITKILTYSYLNHF